MTETTATEIIDKYSKLSLKSLESQGTITVPLKNANGFKPGFETGRVDSLPASTKKRFAKYGIDISKGYPERPETLPLYLDEGYAVRDSEDPNYVERGKNADPKKAALFAAAKEVRHLSKYIGTELVGVQLAELNNQQLDELALLIAERVVVILKDQDLSPQRQLEIGQYFGRVEVHPLAGHVPGLEGTTVIWKDENYLKYPKGLAAGKIWHTDLDHEFTPAAITHLHLDSIPEVGGDTVFISGYAAYDKLSPAFQKFLEGKYAVHRSAHKYYKREDPLAGPDFIYRKHPLIITHPVTGWKALWVNRAHVVSIDGLEEDESRVILNYLFDVLERNLDIQVRITWQGGSNPELGASLLWDNRISNHIAISDYSFDHDGVSTRHGTRVTSLGGLQTFDPNSKSQREDIPHW